MASIFSLSLQKQPPASSITTISLALPLPSSLSPSFGPSKVTSPKFLHLSHFFSFDLTMPYRYSPILLLAFSTSVVKTPELPNNTISSPSLHWSSFSHPLLKQSVILQSVIPRALKPEISCHPIQSLLHIECCLSLFSLEIFSSLGSYTIAGLPSISDPVALRGLIAQFLHS